MTQKSAALIAQARAAERASGYPRITPPSRPPPPPGFTDRELWEYVHDLPPGCTLVRAVCPVHGGGPLQGCDHDCPERTLRSAVAPVRHVAPPAPPPPPPGPGPAVRYGGGVPEAFDGDTAIGAVLRIVSVGLVAWLAYSLWAALL